LKSYSEKEMFGASELRLFRQAAHLVAQVAIVPSLSMDEVRCHELARAVGHVLGLTVQDGWYGYVEHSWLWTRPLDEPVGVRWALPNILDVYAVGSLPQVQLIHMTPATGHTQNYRPLPAPRTDIALSIVELLVEKFRKLQAVT
jgi:hypothetical protein